MPTPSRLALAIDWGAIAPLRLRARTLADGIYAGAHRSARRGAGVEFGGHRPYAPGDDLRWLDRHALLRHGRLLVREFETETDRGLRLVVDASASMSFRGARAPAAKMAHAALLAAALGRIALATGDPVGLGWIGGAGVRPLGASAGRESFERLVGALESAEAAGDASDDPRSVEQAFAAIARRARRGAVIVLLSDLYDLPPGAREAFCALAAGGRTLVAVQVLDPDEVRFPFEGTVRLRALEGGHVVETDADAVRARYTEAMETVRASWSEALLAHGGHLVVAPTDGDAAEQVRTILGWIARPGGPGA